jgi:hypothetical protein
MFDQMVEGADKYITEQGSTWLIFTKEKKWVVEFTNDKTLWFNYNLFKSELELIGKDCTEERDFIKNWFESRFLNTNKVKRTSEFWRLQELNVEDTIENGVRHTCMTLHCLSNLVEDTIENGVRQTNKRLQKPFRSIKDAIQNGVKETRFQKSSNLYRIEDTRTLWGKSGDEGVVEYIIQEGVKDIIEDSYPHKHRVEGVIKNTVKDGI